MPTVTRAVKVGDTLPEKRWTVRFRREWGEGDWKDNIHRGDGSTRYGFRGGLLEGDHLATLLVELLVAYFGEAWYGHGRLQGKILPAYGGEALRTRCIVTAVEPEGEALRVTLSADLVKGDGELALAGQASCLVF
jgi:hypothetical protein